MSSESSIEFESLENLYSRVHSLKHLPRRGWVTRGLQDPESVSDHSYGVAILALIFARKYELDVGRALTIALIHDLAESIIGDVIPADNVDARAKLKAEDQAIRDILHGVDPGGELYELWCDFEHERTPEGRLVRQLDRLEMAFQAHAYEKETGIDLGDFYPYVRDRISDPRLAGILGEIILRRNAPGGSTSG